MKSLYCEVKGGNFGDDLNRILWPLLLPDMDAIESSHAILGLGSFQWVPADKHTKKIHVLGSGGSEPLPHSTVNDYDLIFHFVRGPVTASHWNCPDKSLTDGAVLMMHTELKDTPPEARTHQVGFIPHHTSDQYADYEAICNQLGMKYISPRGGEVEGVISKIKSCDYIITEALHGAIVADLLRKPWMPVSSGQHIKPYKWHDWCQSVGLAYSPYYTNFICTRGMKSLVRFENIFKRGLSSFCIGKERWQYKRILYDTEAQVDLVKEQLFSILNSPNYLLSKAGTLDGLINQAGDIWFDFKKEIY